LLIAALLLVLLAPPDTARAGSAAVHGTVRAEGSLEPVARATVRLPQLGRGVLADERG
jgi:hypothetical protein